MMRLLYVNILRIVFGDDHHFDFENDGLCVAFVYVFPIVLPLSAC